MHFVFDLDGTLLNDNNEIPPKTWKWLVSLKKQNHQLYLNTGRPYQAIVKCLKEKITFFSIISAANGSYLKGINLDQKLYINLNAIEQIKNIKSNIPFAITVSVADALYTNNKKLSQNIIYRLKPQKILPLQTLKAPIHSIRLVFTNSQDNEKFYNIAKNKLKNFNLEMSTNIYLSISNLQASKTNLIKYLEKQNDEQIIYFGDSQNDLSVFRLSNVFCVAPKNAHLDIKNLANLVLNTTNNQDLAFDLALLTQK